MKNKLMIAALGAAIAIASHGGNALVAHAQTATTVTTSDTATLQQQLDNAKAQLINLQMQSGQIPAGDNGAAAQQSSVPVPPLSAMDISSMNTALTALASMLENLQAKIAQDPQFATSHGSAVASVLQSIGNTVASIGTEMTGNNLAMATPNGTHVSGSTGGAGSSAATQPTATTQPTQPAQVAQTSPATTVPTSAAPANTAPATAANIIPQTAQESSSFSLANLNWPLIIVIILIVAAIAIWLWWDDGDEKNQPVTRSHSSTPQKPTQQPLQPINQVSVSFNQGNNANKQPISPQTPLSSAVAPRSN